MYAISVIHLYGTYMPLLLRKISFNVAHCEKYLKRKKQTCHNQHGPDCTPFRSFRELTVHCFLSEVWH